MELAPSDRFVGLVHVGCPVESLAVVVERRLVVVVVVVQLEVLVYMEEGAERVGFY